MGISNSRIGLRDNYNQIKIDVHRSAAAKIQISNILHLLIHKYELIGAAVNIEFLQKESDLAEIKSIYTLEVKEEINSEYELSQCENVNTKVSGIRDCVSVPILRNNLNFGTLIAKPALPNVKSTSITTCELLLFSDKIAEAILDHCQKPDEDYLARINQDCYCSLGLTNLTDDKKSSTTMLNDLYNCLGFTIDIAKEHSALAKAIPYIVNNYNKNFTMKELAEQCCVSASHLSCLIKNRFGLSYKKILMTIRIEKAKAILVRMPARQITNVCADVGFSDLSHFERTFKRAVGESPRDFRSSYRKRLSMSAPTQGILGRGILK